MDPEQPSTDESNVETAASKYAYNFPSLFLKDLDHYRSLIFSGIDFIGNDFDVIFELNTTGIDISSFNSVDSMYGFEKNNNVLRKIIEEKVKTSDATRNEALCNMAYISARCQSVNIPMTKANSHQFKVGLNTIQKVSSSFSMNNQSSINIRMDKDFYIYDIFNIIAGNEDLSELKDPNSEKKEYYSKLHPHIAMTALEKIPKINIFVKRRNILENVTENIYSDGMTRNYKESDFKYVDVHKRVNELLRTGKSHRDLTKLGTMQLPYFMFKDVKFIGFGSALDLDRDGSGPQVMPLEFIFKNLVMCPMEDPGITELKLKQIGSGANLGGLIDELEDELGVSTASNADSSAEEAAGAKKPDYSNLIPDAGQQMMAAAVSQSPANTIKVIWPSSSFHLPNIDSNFTPESLSGNIQKLKDALNIEAGLQGAVNEFTNTIDNIKDETNQMVEDVKNETEEMKTVAQESKESLIKYFEQGGATGTVLHNSVSGNANDAIEDIIEDIEQETK